MRLLSILAATTVLIQSGNSLAQNSSPNPCQQSAVDQVRIHKIAPHDTLTSIAQQYQVSESTLTAINPDLKKPKLSVGTEIFIPPYNGYYVVTTQGQTWQQLAAAYGVRADILFEVNGCQKTPQQVVFIPGVTSASASSNQTPPPPIITGYPLPIIAPIGLGYGWQLNRRSGQMSFHGGLDLIAKIGTPVLAAGDGIVAYANQQGNYGNLVVINHQSGKQTRYAHLNSISVTLGQQIIKGTPIGTIGTSGTPDIPDPHLHFEVRSNSKEGWVAENPNLYFPANARILSPY